MWKSKRTKHTILGRLLEVEMFKKCTELRRCGAKHISKSKVLKTESLGPLLDGQMLFCGADARSSAPSNSEQNVMVL